jgi:hypothetical protein
VAPNSQRVPVALQCHRCCCCCRALVLLLLHCRCWPHSRAARVVGRYNIIAANPNYDERSTSLIARRSSENDTDPPTRWA